jgi:hypothetical protein
MAEARAGFTNLTRLELRCSWLSDGWDNAGERAQRREVANLVGGQPAALRAIWLPDDYNGPQPGHPWIEFGRMMLDPASWTGEALAGDRAGSREMIHTAPVLRGQRGTDMASQPVSLPAVDTSGGDGSGSQLESHLTEDSSSPAVQFPDGRRELAAAMALWDHLAGPHSSPASLDAALVANPFVTSRWLNDVVAPSTLFGHGAHSIDRNGRTSVLTNSC